MSDKHLTTTFKHALIYSASGILGKAIGFIMLPVYAHYLRGEGYGIIGMIDVVISLMTLLIGYGVQGAMIRFYYEKKGESQQNKFLSTAIILMLILVLLVSFPAILFNETIAFYAFGEDGLGHYIILATITFIAGMSEKSAETYILIQQRPFFYALLSLAKLIIALSLNIYLIVYLEMGVLGYLYSGLIVAVIFTVFLHSYVLFNVGVWFIKKDAIDILKFTLPLLPGYMAMFIRNNLDRVLLRMFYGLTIVGVYEMLFKFATLIGLLIVEPFSKIWGVKRFEIADTETGPATMASVFTLQLSIMLFVGLILSLEIPIVLKILTPEEFWLSGSIVGLAVLSRIFLASYYHFFFGLLYAKKTGIISIIQTISMIVNVFLGLMLIIPFGIYGAILASFLSNITQCVLAYRIAKPYYPIPFEWKKIISILAITIFMYIVIDRIKVSEISLLDAWLNIDTIKGGELFTYIVENLPLIFEGMIKFILSFFFLAALIASNIIPYEKVQAMLKNKSVKLLFK